MIISITGTLSAGKGSIVDILKDQGFAHYSVRGFLNEELERRGLEKNRDNQVYIANKLRSEHSPTYIVENLYEQALKENSDVVIESLRTPGEVKSLKGKDEFYLLAVDADPKLRYERAVERSSEDDKVSFEEFIEQERREMSSEDPNKQNISECMKMADYKIENNGSLEDLRGKLNKILEDINKT